MAFTARYMCDMDKAPKPAVLAIRVPLKVRAELAALAAAEERPLSFYVRKAIQAYLDERKREMDDDRRVPRY